MIEIAIDRLIALIPIIGAASKSKREQADKALESVSLALTETCLYVNRFQTSGDRNENTEAELARHWAKAAVPLRHFDQELSDICEYKSQYWVNPSEWDPSKTNGLAIDLESVRDKYRAKLNPN